MESEASTASDRLRAKFSTEEDIERSKPVLIPEHLRRNAPDPLSCFEKENEKSAADEKTSDELSAEANRLKAKLAELNKLRAKRTTGKPRARPPPPPPPMAWNSKKAKRK